MSWVNEYKPKHMLNDKMVKTKQAALLFRIDHFIPFSLYKNMFVTLLTTL